MTSSDGDWSTTLPTFNRLSVSAPPSPLHSTPTETAAASATVDVMGHQQILLLRMRRPRPKRVDSSSDRLLQTIFTRHTALTEVDQVSPLLIKKIVCITIMYQYPRTLYTIALCKKMSIVYIELLKPTNYCVKQC